MLTKKNTLMTTTAKKFALSALLATLASQVYAESITVISFGGLNEDAQDKAFYKPFAAAGKGTVEAGEYNGEMARIRAMVETGQVGWDVVEVEGPELVRGCNEGMFEPLGKNWATRLTLSRGRFLNVARGSSCGPPC